MDQISSPRPFDRERRLRAALRISGPRTFASRLEESFFLQGFDAKSLDELRAEGGMGTREEAQELAFQAMEAPRQEQAAQLARQALELDSTCLDAIRVEAVAESQRPREQHARLETLLSIATARYDKTTLETHYGHLWGVVDMRPFLRLHHALALLQERVGKPRKATRSLEALLKLDVQDPLNARHDLVRLYLVTRQPQPLFRLFNTFPEDDSAIFAWGRVLERLHSGMPAGAFKLLADARARNPHVEAILTGKALTPRAAQGVPARGSAEEAVEVLKVMGTAWTTDRDAMVWLIRGGLIDEA